MQYKICSKCGLKLPADAEHFHRNKQAKDGLRPECKECYKKRSEQNKGRKAAYMKKYYKEHKEELKDYHEHWRDNNRESLRQYYKDYYKNSDVKKNCNKRWNDAHKEQIKKYQRLDAKND